MCDRCRRPRSVCYCAHIVPVQTKTRVVLLQHPRERDVPIGTAHMASLCLPNAELHVGLDWRGSEALARAVSDSTRPPMLLYPGDDAVGALDVLAQPPTHPITLIVVDGTWIQTRKMVHRNPDLARLPRLSFAPPRPSQYQIRKEPHAICVSTIEALSYVLGALEGDPQRFTALLAPFRAMVDTQVRCRDDRREGRFRHPRPERGRHDPVPPPIRSLSRHLVCVVGEANAWPYGSPERQAGDRDELVHWVAIRPATGEVFDCLAAPNRPLSPTTPAHIGVAQEALDHASPVDTLLERWLAFVEADDVICSWGRYTTGLLLRAGGALPETRIDLRQVARELMQDRFGTMEALAQSLGSESPPSRLASGRAGVRLGLLVALVRRFATLPPTRRASA